MQRVRVVVLILASFLPMTGFASNFLPTEQECREGSDFIKNAARSRDNGFSREFLLKRFEDDVIVLSGMDPEKRWFIRSPGATKFLRQALVDVFSRKKNPKDQGAAFLETCIFNTFFVSPDDL